MRSTARSKRQPPAPAKAASTPAATCVTSGACGVEVELRDEVEGGVRCFGRCTRRRACHQPPGPPRRPPLRHASGIQPQALSADALTKFVAPGLPLLAGFWCPGRVCTHEAAQSAAALQRRSAWPAGFRVAGQRRGPGSAWLHFRGRAAEGLAAAGREAWRQMVARRGCDAGDLRSARSPAGTCAQGWQIIYRHGWPASSRQRRLAWPHHAGRGRGQRLCAVPLVPEGARDAVGWPMPAPVSRWRCWCWRTAEGEADIVAAWPTRKRPSPSFFWHDYASSVACRGRPAGAVRRRSTGRRSERDRRAGHVVLQAAAMTRCPIPKACCSPGILPQQAEAGKACLSTEFAARNRGRAGSKPGTIGASATTASASTTRSRASCSGATWPTPMRREWRNGLQPLGPAGRGTAPAAARRHRGPSNEDGRPLVPARGPWLPPTASKCQHESAHDAASGRASLHSGVALAAWCSTSPAAAVGLLPLSCATRTSVRPRDRRRPSLPAPSAAPWWNAAAWRWIFAGAHHGRTRTSHVVWGPRDLAERNGWTPPRDKRRRLYTRAEDPSEGGGRRPIKTIHGNKSPIVIGNLECFGLARRTLGLTGSRRCATPSTPPPSAARGTRALCRVVFVRSRGRAPGRRRRGLGLRFPSATTTAAAARPPTRIASPTGWPRNSRASLDDPRLAGTAFPPTHARNFPATLVGRRTPSGVAASLPRGLRRGAGRAVSRSSSSVRRRLSSMPTIAAVLASALYDGASVAGAHEDGPSA